MATSSKRPPPLQRRDATGHLDAKYAADLRRRSLATTSRNEETAFLDRAKSADSLAEALGEEFLEAATTGEDATLAARDENMPEDEGGPFIVTKGRDEFAQGRDRSNPKGATREPFPKSRADEADQEENG